MNIRPTQLLLLALALACAASPALAPSGSVLTGSGASLNATLTYYEPIPALPGELLDVFVQIENSGESSETVRVEFIDNWPFSIDNEADRIKSTGSIPARNSFLAKYTVRVSEDATPGVSYIKIKYYAGKEEGGQTALLPINVFSSSVALNFENLKIEPDIFIPGGKGSISFDLHNFAPLTISDGYVKLDLDAVDIVPVSSTNYKRFTNIRSGEVRKFSFDLISSPDLEPGVYRVPATLNFTDQQGNRYATTATIGLIVGSEPAVSVVVEESAIAGGSGELIFRVTNQGLGEVKFVNLVIEESEAYDVTGGSPVRYIGNIDSDDYKTARVPFLLADEGSGELRIPVRLEFADALNAPHVQEEELVVTLPQEQGSGGGKWIALVLVLAIIVGIVLRRKKR